MDKLDFPKLLNQWHPGAEDNNFEIEYRLVWTGIKAKVQYKYRNEGRWGVENDLQKALDVVTLKFGG